MRARGAQGPMHTAVTVLREEGLRGMWSGCGATVARQGSNQMALFWGKHYCDGLFWNKRDGDGRTLSPGQSAASGFVAACIGPVLNNPFDVVKVRCQRLPRIQSCRAYAPGVGWREGLRAWCADRLRGRPAPALGASS